MSVKKSRRTFFNFHARDQAVQDLGYVEPCVADGETGMPVAPGDVVAWTSALADLLADPARRQRMGAVARARAETKFIWTACARDLEAVLQESVKCAAS